MHHFNLFFHFFKLFPQLAMWHYCIHISKCQQTQWEPLIITHCFWANYVIILRNRVIAWLILACCHHFIMKLTSIVGKEPIMTNLYEVLALESVWRISNVFVSGRYVLGRFLRYSRIFWDIWFQWIKEHLKFCHLEDFFCGVSR